MKKPKKKFYKDRYYFIYSVYLFDKKLHKKTAILIQNTTDIYKVPKFFGFLGSLLIDRRIRKMVEYQLGYKDFEILRFSVEQVDVPSSIEKTGNK